jgi:hypothetical protein
LRGVRIGLIRMHVGANIALPVCDNQIKFTALFELVVAAGTGAAGLAPARFWQGGTLSHKAVVLCARLRVSARLQLHLFRHSLAHLRS